MNLKLITFITTVALSFGCSSVSNTYVSLASDNEKEIAIKRAYESFGMIYAKRQGSDSPALIGTLFAVSNTHMITAAHVCLGVLSNQILRDFEQDIYVRHLNKDMEMVESSGLEIVNVDTKDDLCLLKKSNHGFTPLSIASMEEVKTRDKVTILGAPMGVFPFETEGRIAYVDAYKAVGDKIFKGKLLLTAQAFGGNSGGPVLDSHGKVVGVLVMGYRPYPQISVATNAERLNLFIQKYGK